MGPLALGLADNLRETSMATPSLHLQTPMVCADLPLRVNDREAVADQALLVTVAVVVMDLRVADTDSMVLDRAEVDTAHQVVAEGMDHLVVVEAMAHQQEAMVVP